MATTAVDIYNLALHAIGESTSIADYADESLAADVCKRHYPQCLRAMLQLYDWPWATKQAELDEEVDTFDSETIYAQSALVRQEGWVFASVAGSNLGHTPDREDPTYWTVQYPLAVGWGRVYSMPNDCVRPSALLLDGERIGLRVPQTKYPYEMQMNNAGDDRVLCTDLEPGDFVLEYVAMPVQAPLREDADLTSPTDYPSMYSPLFVEALAYFLASKIAVPLTKDRELALECFKMYQLKLSEAVSSELNSQQKDPDPLPSSIRARY